MLTVSSTIFKHLESFLFDRYIYAARGNNYSNYFIAFLTSEIRNNEIIIPNSYREMYIAGNTNVLCPLVINIDYEKPITTFKNIFKKCKNGTFIRCMLKGEIYYVSKSIILDKDYNCLLLSTSVNKLRNNSLVTDIENADLNCLQYKETLVYISDRIFNEKYKELYKGIYTTLLPFTFLYNSILKKYSAPIAPVSINIVNTIPLYKATHPLILGKNNNKSYIDNEYLNKLIADNMGKVQF